MPRGPEAIRKTPTVLTLEVADALASLDTSRRGLENIEATRRLAIDGPNALPAPRQRSVVLEFAAQFSNMFAILLVVAAALTFATFFLTSPRNFANLELAFGILGVVLLNALIGFFQEHSAERTAEALQAMVPHSARVLQIGRASCRERV